MKKAMVFATMALVGVAVMTGCASSTSLNSVTAWQESRVFSSEIAAKTTASQTLTSTDVQYTSVNDNAALAAPINALASASASLYLQVVNGVDGLAAQNAGRQVYAGIQKDVAGGQKVEDLLAKMTTEDKAAYTAYGKAIASEDQEQIINTVATPLLNTIKAESAKVTETLASLKETPELQSLTGSAALQSGAKIAADGKALLNQLSDASTGAKLWIELLMQDKNAKTFMADNPIE